MSKIEQSIKRKIEQIGIPLKQWDIRINRGILTGFNDAFIISTERRDVLVAEDPRSAEIIRPNNFFRKKATGKSEHKPEKKGWFD